MLSTATGHSKDQLQINLTENGIKSLFFQVWIMATELLLSGWGLAAGSQISMASSPALTSSTWELRT